MTEILKAVLVLFVLLGSSALGRVVYPLLSERHRSREVIDFVRLVIAKPVFPHRLLDLCVAIIRRMSSVAWLRRRPGARA